MLRPATCVAIVAAGSLFSAAASADPTPAAALRESETRASPPPAGGIYLGLGGGWSPDVSGGLAGGSVLLDRPLGGRVGLWLGGESILLVRSAGDTDLAFRLTFALRFDLWRSASGSLRIVSDLGFAHMHEASLGAWGAHPVENFLGESNYGMGHRSGLTAGGGVLFTPWIDRVQGFSRGLRLLVQASTVWMPDDMGPHWFLSLLTSIGLAV